MSSYSVSQAMYGDAEVVVLRDERVGVEARLAPSIGCNVFRLTTRLGDAEVDILEAPAEVQVLRDHPTGHGIPVMVPYPGRVRDGQFEFQGRRIWLPLSDERGHAIHGAVRQRAWKVVESTTDGHAAVTCAISTGDYPEMLGEWPWPIAVTHTTSLQSGVLTIALQVRNEGDSPMPLGVGLHPYFRTPIGPTGDRNGCLVQVDASQWWEQELAFPTGRVETPSGSVDLRRARPIGDLPAHDTPRGRSVNQLYGEFDRPYGDPLAATGISAAITDPALGTTIRMTTSDTFRALVLYTPPAPQSTSIEPHTCVPNAFNLAAAGRECGLLGIEPDATWSGWARFEVTTQS